MRGVFRGKKKTEYNSREGKKKENVRTGRKMKDKEKRLEVLYPTKGEGAELIWLVCLIGR
jgi:hypothetical protein